jgi:hypothetical protein
MSTTKVKNEIQQQYKQGGKIEPKQTILKSNDITSEQWFWAMAVIS